MGAGAARFRGGDRKICTEQSSGLGLIQAAGSILSENHLNVYLCCGVMNEPRRACKFSVGFWSSDLNLV